ncbi:hypothetical protein [Aurantibacter sp.]|uniref:hypothetical protein n=1 Tax=Aurantibacter sp. TaxID=2807103 RepID=UPI003264F722
MSRKKYLILLLCISVSCKQDSFSYKYHEQIELFSCDLKDAKMFKEALYSFEDDLKNYYTDSDTKENAYEVFVNAVEGGNTVNRVKIVSDHSINVFKELRKIDNLWIVTDSKNSGFNYNHPIFACIEKNIQDVELKGTFSVLRKNNSLRPNLIISRIKDNYTSWADTEDKALDLYVSLEFYYHHMSHMFIPKRR